VRFLESQPAEALLGRCAPGLTTLCCTCVRYLEDRSLLRVAHALETLALAFHCLASTRFSPVGGCSTMDALRCAAGGTQHSAAFFRRLLPACAALLGQREAPAPLRRAALRTLLVLAGGSGNVNANAFLAAMQEAPSELAEALLALLCEAESAAPDWLLSDALLLLATMLGWSETRNAVAQRLGAASPQLLARLLRTVCRAMRGETLGAAAAAGGGGEQPTSLDAAAEAEPAGDLSSLLAEALSSVLSSASVLAGGGGEAPGAHALAYLRLRCAPHVKSAPPATAVGAALLLHSLCAASPLLRSHGAWLTGVGAAGLGGAWQESLALTIGLAAAEAEEAAAAAAAAAHGAQPAPPPPTPLLALRCATLALVVEDARGGEFLATTDCVRLLASTNLLPGPGPPPPPTPRPASDCLLGLAAAALAAAEAAPAAQAPSAAAAAGLALYCAHAQLHAAARRGGPPLRAAACEPLWRACCAQLRSFSRLSRPAESPAAVRLAAQTSALLGCALATAGALLPAGALREGLLEAMLALRPHLPALEAAVRAAGAQHAEDGEAAAGGDERSPRVLLRPLRLVAQAFPDAPLDGAAAAVWGKSGTVALLRLARLDAAHAAGPARREAAAGAVAAAARALAAAARAGGAVGGGERLPRTGELDDALSRDPEREFGK